MEQQCSFPGVVEIQHFFRTVRVYTLQISFPLAKVNIYDSTGTTTLGKNEHKLPNERVPRGKPPMAKNDFICVPC